MEQAVKRPQAFSLYLLQVQLPMPRASSEEPGQYLAVSLHDLALLVMARPCLSTPARSSISGEKLALGQWLPFSVSPPGPMPLPQPHGPPRPVCGLPSGAHDSGRKGPCRLAAPRFLCSWLRVSTLDGPLFCMARGCGVRAPCAYSLLDTKGGPAWRCSEEGSAGHFGHVLFTVWASPVGCK